MVKEFRDDGMSVTRSRTDSGPRVPFSVKGNKLTYSPEGKKSNTFTFRIEDDTLYLRPVDNELGPFILFRVGSKKETKLLKE